jgi:Zn finger protein HypA/HybF involved in hydrogenase expression
MSGLTSGKHSHLVSLCRECGHRGQVSREISREHICPQCRSYGYGFITFNANELRSVNDRLKKIKAKPIAPGEVQ